MANIQSFGQTYKDVREKNFALYINQKLFGTSSRIRFYKKLSRLLRNGVRLQDAIFQLSEISSSRSSTSSQTYFYREVNQKILDGLSLSDALAGWCPESERMMVAAGEGAGNLDFMLDRLGRSVEAVKSMRSAIISALMYPTFLFFATLGLVFFIADHAVPIMMKASGGHLQIHGIALILFHMSNWVRSWRIYAFLGFVSLVILGMVVSMPRWKGWGRVWADRIPPWSLYRIVQGSGFLLSLGALLSAGVRLQDALEQMSNDGSAYTRSRITAILDKVSDGANMGRAMAETGNRFPDEDLIEDILIYADLSSFDEVLIRIGEQFLEHGQEIVKIQSAMLDKFAMIFMGVSMGFVTFGMMEMSRQVAQAISHTG